MSRVIDRDESWDLDRDQEHDLDRDRPEHIREQDIDHPHDPRGESDNASNQQDLAVDFDREHLDAIINLYADDGDEYSYRCMWDGTGSGDVDRMAMTCLRLSESECMAAQHGVKDARCVWRARSHYGMNLEMDSLEADVVDPVEESIIAGDTSVDLDAYDRDLGHDQIGRQEVDQSKASVSQNIGCLWDQTGCANGCDETAMVTRCAAYNHDQETCEGEEGLNKRCVWGHGDHSQLQQEELARFISGGAVGADMNAVDVVLGVVFMVSVGMVCWRLYRCWIKRGYIKLAEDPQDVEPLMMQQV